MHLFGIANWLLKETIEQKYEKIVFCARDGYWIMRAYQILKKVYNNTPKEEYLYISRRALIPATLQNKFDFYKLAELIDIYKYTPKTILKYFKDILENIENLDEECNKVGIDANKKFESQNEFYIFMNVIMDKFYDKNKHLSMLDALTKYFSNIFSGNTCIFDIGYSAKPEMYLSKLCKKPIDTYFVNISNEEAFNHAKIGKLKLSTYFDYRPAITGVIRESLMSTADPSCIGYKVSENNEVSPVFEERQTTYKERFVFDVMQNEAMNFIKDLVNIFGSDIEILYYQKYYISLPHEMYIHSATEFDQDVLRNVNFEDAVGLGDKIDAIHEWNREMKDKNQKRSIDIFDEERIGKLENEIKRTTEENEKIKMQIHKQEVALNTQIEEQKKELQNIYNSKRWKYFDKINKLLGRK